jgi:hypothetical protein
MTLNPYPGDGTFPRAGSSDEKGYGAWQIMGLLFVPKRI